MAWKIVRGARRMLGLLEPGAAERVELREAEQPVHVVVEPTAGTACTSPDCGITVPAYDHAERRWRHLDTCRFTTMLIARVPSSGVARMA